MVGGGRKRGNAETRRHGVVEEREEVNAARKYAIVSGQMAEAHGMGGAETIMCLCPPTQMM